MDASTKAALTLGRKRRPPMAAGTQGKPLTVKQLIGLLMTAHPDSVIYVDKPWGRVVVAALDAGPSISHHEPQVRLYLKEG